MSQGKILLVDDSPSVRTMLEDKLHEHGFTVHSAVNGVEALDLLDIFTPDMIITDVSMPEMDGFELCRRLKQDPTVKDVPIIMLTAATEEKEVCEGLGLGASDYIRKPFSPTELVLRVENILKGAREKTRILEMFSRHTSPEVMRELLSRPDDLMLAGELREVSILFADIRGFTQMVSGARPQEIVRELNQVLTLMSEAVIGEEGTLDKFLGDGIMAIFGAPLKHEDDSLRAVRAARRIQDSIVELNRERDAKNMKPMRVGIGISRGAAVVGNIGSPRRVDYTAIGDCVNMAARLQALAEGGMIVITGEVFKEVDGKIEAASMGPAKIKGKSEPIEVYEVKG